MQVSALEDRQTWPLGCVSGKWPWWVLLEPQTSLSSFLPCCRFHHGMGRLCRHPPEPHLESHLVRQLLAGRWEGALPRDSHIRFSELRGRARGAPGAPGAWRRPFWQPHGPRTSCVTSGPVVKVFSLSKSPPLGLQVGLSPPAGFLHLSSTEVPLPCPPASSVWPP